MNFFGLKLGAKPSRSKPSAADTGGVRLDLFWVASVLVAAVGARLWLVHSCGTTLPFWDQWEEARVAILPYLDGHLSFKALLSPHSEHRIFFTRIYALGLYLWNGQFDNNVEMVGNVLLHSLSICGFGWIVVRLVGRSYWPLIASLMYLNLVLPFAWENTLGGFHSPFYFMTLFSLLTIYLLGFTKPGSVRWFLGLVTALCALVSLGSGFLVAAAILGLGALRLLRDPSSWRRHWITVAVGLVFVVLGWCLHTKVAHHDSLRAPSLIAFAISFGKHLAWPWVPLPPYALFNLFPMLLLLWVYMRKREAIMLGEEMVFALGGWAVLQASACAYARGNLAFPQWRYMDSLCFLMVANALALALLFTRHRDQIPFRRLVHLAACGWVVACASGLLLLDWRAWTVDIPLRQMYYRLQQVTTRAYLATNDRHYLQTHQKEYLSRFAGPDNPDPNHANALIAVLDAPHIRPMLPAPVRAPLPMLPMAGAGFVTNSNALVKPAVPGEVSWSSFASDGAKHTGRFESAPIPQSRFPFLEFLVGGELGQPGLSLSVVELATGKVTPVRPRRAPGDKWLACRVRAPRGEFKVIAMDENDAAWFAFQAPREVGRLSWAAERLAAQGPLLFFFGTAMFLFGVGGALWHRRTASRQ